MLQVFETAATRFQDGFFTKSSRILRQRDRGVEMMNAVICHADDCSAINQLEIEQKSHHSGGRTVGPMSAGDGRPGVGGCGAPGGGSNTPQFVRARICSAVAAVTK
jgi:hypothetical protein